MCVVERHTLRMRSQVARSQWRLQAPESMLNRIALLAGRCMSSVSDVVDRGQLHAHTHTYTHCICI